MTRMSRRVALECLFRRRRRGSQEPHVVSNSEITQIIQKELCEYLIVLTLCITHPDDVPWEDEEGGDGGGGNDDDGGGEEALRWWERIFRMIYAFV